MKKVILFAAALVMMAGTMSLNAQNKFKGIVKYKITAEGKQAEQFVQQLGNTAEIKVMGEQVSIQNPSATMFTLNQMINCVRQDGTKMYMAVDYSMYISFLNSQDVALSSYQGDGKLLQSNSFTQSQIDSLTIPCTEGYYIEYVDQTKKIAGVDAKLARIHSFDKEGEDHPTEMWYCAEMGPQANFIFQGVKGIPMEYSINLGDNTITFVVEEVVKGKVKEVDFLMPAGYKAISDEEFSAFMEELGEELKAYGGGEDED